MITVQVQPKVKVTVTTEQENLILTSVKSVTTNIEGEKYKGEYVVTPSFDSQILNTSGKTLQRDIEVEAIYVGQIQNASGGNTVYIGGIINA